MEHTRHAPQDGGIHILGAICGAHDHDATPRVSDKSVPETHELSFHHGRRFVVRRISCSHERIWNDA